MVKRLFFFILILSISITAFAEKTHFIWTSFSSGELTPLIDGQVNFDKYYTGVKTLENFIVRPQGPVSNRSGFRYIAETKTSSSKSRLVPFIFSDEQAYVLEFGNEYIRFYRDGGQIQEPDSDTILLVHANEADASTTIVDSSLNEFTITAVSGAQTNESEKKFGNASMIFDETDEFTVADDPLFDFSAGVFTIDAWIRVEDVTSAAGVIYNHQTDSNNKMELIYFNEDVLFTIKAAGSNIVRLDSNGGVAINTWHHVAVVENGDDYYLFVDGVIKDSATDTDRASNYTDTVDIGMALVSDNFRIDELRVSGVARWSTAFTPSTTEYGVDTSSSTPLELTTNVDYVESDLFELQFAQSADTLYIAHEDYPPRKLLRVTDTTWVLEDINFFPFPFLQKFVEPAANLTLTNATVGDSALPRTFTASAAIFKSGDVGRTIREKSGYGNGEALIKTFTNTTNVNCDIYKAFSGTSLSASEWEFIGNSSTATLTFPSATIVAGDVITATASQNVFESADVGNYISIEGVEGSTTITMFMKILSYTSPTVVTVVAMRAGDLDGIPEEELGIKETNTIVAVKFNPKTLTSAVISAGNWIVTEPMWTSTLGYPKAVTFFEDRLLWAGSPSFPQTIWGSEVDNYESHLTGTNDSDAYRFTLAGSQVNEIQWLDASNNLLVGTSGAEWVLGSRGADEPTTPTNVTARIQTGHGSASVQPVNMGQSILFLQKGAEKVREMIFNFDIDRHESPDMTILAEHITEGGIVEMDFQEDPVTTGWFVRNDGTLLSMTLLRDQEVIGWGRHITDGSFESIAVIPGSEGDELWVIVNRTIAGLTVRYVEKLETLFDDTVLNSEQAFFVDSGLSYNGVSTSTITGLDHLESETVSILADGVVQTDKVVRSGEITLDSAASLVHVGLPYTSTLQTMRIEHKDSQGTAQGRGKNINRVVFRLDNTKEVQYSDSEDGTFKTETFTSLSSGDTEVDFVTSNDETNAYVAIQNTEPTPITVLAIIPEVNINAN
jgi:hypothetical protein